MPYHDIKMKPVYTNSRKWKSSCKPDNVSALGTSETASPAPVLPKSDSHIQVVFVSNSLGAIVDEA